jgi:DNA-binding Lrp family transcriptional regulator
VIDHIDRNILRHLKEDGRMTATALAGEVGLTVAPCHRRLRDLEASGVIRGYRADIDPAALGLGFEAIVFVTLRQVDRATMEIFENRVAANPTIVEAQPAVRLARLPAEGDRRGPAGLPALLRR